MNRAFFIFLFGALLAASTYAAEPNPIDIQSERVWLRGAKYGVFVHYLPGGAGWQGAVDSFDVESFASQMLDAGVDYVFFTLGQNHGYYCSPNATYETFTGYQPNQRCSRRDLPMELADALSRHHIRLMLYLPSRAPQQDSQAMLGLSDVDQGKPAPQEFTRKWSAVIREWSKRYGTRISGWWFDGAYNTAGWDDLSKEYNWTTWADACRAGNSNSLLAFNSGTDPKRAFLSLSKQENYTAGEQTDWKPTPQQFPPPTGVQWHILSFLGPNWGQAEAPRSSDTAMIDYIRAVNAQGGVVTMDVSVSTDGKVFAPHLNQLRAIKAALR